MKSSRTGDQSGGIEPRDGSSTPVKTGGQNEDDSASKKTSVSTDDKNPSGAFKQNPRVTPRADSDS